MGYGHSHLKHFTATPVHKMVTVPMTAAGIQTASVCIPREAAFISCIPCVSGKRATIFCMVSGITSKGSVAPEKTSMGKYSRQAMTLAIFSFFAIPPTIIPMLKVETREEMEKALRETIYKVCKNGLEKEAKELDPADMTGLQRVVQRRRQLEKLHISLD